nr:MAG TPA: hypothetical protein [Caudoviricetes sp.]
MKRHQEISNHSVFWSGIEESNSKHNKSIVHGYFYYYTSCRIFAVSPSCHR